MRRIYKALFIGKNYKAQGKGNPESFKEYPGHKEFSDFIGIFAVASVGA